MLTIAADCMQYIDIYLVDDDKFNYLATYLINLHNIII